MNMFLRSMQAQSAWLADSLIPGRHPGAPLSAQRCLALGLGLGPYCLQQSLNWAGLALDHGLYPQFKDSTPERPLFVLGLPRSGTTFVHRSLAAAHSDFHSMQTWEALFAPSVSQRRFWQQLSALDQRWLRGGLQKGVEGLSRTLAGGLDDIHPVSLADAEEDYLALLPAAACFLAVLAFPFRQDLWQLGYLDEMPANRRNALIQWYLQILARQQFAQGQGRRLLSKNAAFGSWAGALAQALPHAQFIICIRDPAQGLDSQLSAIEPGLQAFGTAGHEQWMRTQFLKLFTHQYRHLRQVCEDIPERVQVVEMESLALDPAGVLRRALGGLNIPLSSSIEEALRQAQRYGRGHRSRPQQRPLADHSRQPHGRLPDLARAFFAPELANGEKCMTLLEAQAARPELGVHWHAAAPRPRALRVAFFSDALPERNGAGSYYTDLVAHLRQSNIEAQLFQPQLKSRWTRFALPLPGDSTQKLLTPNAPRLWRECLELQPDIIIAITPGPFGLLGMTLAKRLGCAFASGFHTQFEELSKLYWDPISRRIASGYLETTNRLICRASATVMVHNSDLSSTVRRLGARNVDVMGTPLAPNFVHHPAVASRGQLRKVCFAGRLAPEKNVSQIIAAAQEHPQLSFAIAGEGPLRKSLQKQAKGLNNVEFLGWLDREALRQVVDSSDLLLLPSALETFGTVALEAMARGRPALVAEGAGIHRWPELAVGLYTQRSSETVASALQRLLQLDPALRQARSEQARQAALSLHQMTMQQWLDLLQSHATRAKLPV